jgi:hypothetical protein
VNIGFIRLWIDKSIIFYWEVGCLYISLVFLRSDLENWENMFYYFVFVCAGEISLRSRKLYTIKNVKINDGYVYFIDKNYNYDFFFYCLYFLPFL